MNHLSLLLDILTVIAPVFAMILMGLFLKRIHLIDERFIDTASNLVFNATMPALIFFSISQADFSEAFQPKVVLFFSAATLASFLLSALVIKGGRLEVEKATFIVSASRGNCGVLSFSLAASHYGDLGLALGGVMGGVAAVTANVGTIITYTLMQQQGKPDLGKLLLANLKSPLLIALFLGASVSYFHIKFPAWFLQSGSYFSSLSLPLALMCVGGSLTLSALKHSSVNAIGASLTKLLLIPLLGCLVAAFWLDFTTIELGMLFLFLGSPTAASVFAISRYYRGDSELASASILLSTLMASITIVAGLFIIEVLGGEI